MERRQFLKGLGLTGLAAGLGRARWALAAGDASLEHRRGGSPADDDGAPPRVNTFSICAVNTKTGEAGVAVASKCLSVGRLVCYAAPGIGAIATQATCNPNYGPGGLELLAKGIPAAEVVQRLTEQDVTVTPNDERFRKIYHSDRLTEEGVDFFRDKGDAQIYWLTSRIRQLGVVDRQGRAATHNGARIFPWSGSLTGDGFSCQGNLLAGEKVIADMADAFQKNRGKGDSLVPALLAALEAGNAAGGDKRGRQAAAMLVVRDRAHWTWSDRWCDVRVDDHDTPVAELGRILRKVGFVRD